jgi:hypothetical protein
MIYFYFYLFESYYLFDYYYYFMYAYENESKLNRLCLRIVIKSGFHPRYRREKSISILMILQYWEYVYEGT